LTCERTPAKVQPQRIMVNIWRIESCAPTAHPHITTFGSPRLVVR
jgi:hypothetical protein